MLYLENLTLWISETTSSNEKNSFSGIIIYKSMAEFIRLELLKLLLDDPKPYDTLPLREIELVGE